METKILVGKRIRTAREKAGLTVDQVAFRCDWTKSRLSNYENGIRAAGIEEINKISDALEPFLGKYVNFYLVQGLWPSELNSKLQLPALTIDKAIKVFKSVIGDAMDFGRLKLEPGLSATELVEVYSEELAKISNASSGHEFSRDAQAR